MQNRKEGKIERKDCKYEEDIFRKEDIFSNILLRNLQQSSTPPQAGEWISYFSSLLAGSRNRTVGSPLVRLSANWSHDDTCWSLITHFHNRDLQDLTLLLKENKTKSRGLLYISLKHHIYHINLHKHVRKSSTTLVTRFAKTEGKTSLTGTQDLHMKKKNLTVSLFYRFIL